MEIETHPLEPFLPAKSKLLMLGSFPPQRKRWSMDFYYPNLNNDMWRIVGLLFFGDKDHFLNDTRKAFCRFCKTCLPSTVLRSSVLSISFHAPFSL